MNALYKTSNKTTLFGNDIYKQVTGIPIGANYAPLVADLFLFCYESEFM